MNERASHSCKGCEHRHVGCHSKCQHYQGWSKAIRENADRRRRDELAEMFQIKNAFRMREKNQLRKQYGRLHYN